jgi:hypothetical protein
MAFMQIYKAILSWQAFAVADYTFAGVPTPIEQSAVW